MPGARPPSNSQFKGMALVARSRPARIHLLDGSLYTWLGAKALSQVSLMRRNQASSCDRHFNVSFTRDSVQGKPMDPWRFQSVTAGSGFRLRTRQKSSRNFARSEVTMRTREKEGGCG